MNTVLFDLDGTLLPIDMKEFIDTYTFLLKNRLLSSDYNADEIIGALWAGQDAMVHNNGMITNEECFWKAFEKYITKGQEKLPTKFKRKLEKELTKFYQEDFGVVRYIAKPSQDAYESVKILCEKGYQLVLATNPIFPEVATKERLSWTGLSEEDFSIITTYENSCFAKPNLEYYKFLLKIIDKDPEDCLMVGNDVNEDMCARNIGMDVFLIDTYVVNTKNEDTFDLKKGNWSLFKEYVTNLPSLN